LGLNEVAGILGNLEDGLREVGVRADLHNLGGNVLGYRQHGSRTAGVIRLRGGSAWQRRIWRTLISLNRALKAVRAAAVLPIAALRYDAFVLEGRDLFFNGRGLWLLRRLGKRIVVVFLGSDHRPPYLNGIWLQDATDQDYGRLARDTDRASARVQRAERYADAIVALPTSAQFHTRPFVHLLAFGLPTPLREVASRVGPNSPVRVLHCPTNVAAKGTIEIEAGLERLKSQGLAVELELLHGVPHSEILTAIQRSDVVVDQLYSDTPMAVLASEAASLGRPAIVGSYAHAEFAGLASKHMMPPTLMCHPADFESAALYLLADEDARTVLGQRAREFVREQWSPPSVARRLVDLIAGRVDASWLVDPDQLTYIGGFGIPDHRLGLHLAAYIRHEGVRALRLERRPRLRAAILAKAGIHVDAYGPR
jgi:glycosyltransferase involved in cell wall biosynthesis